MSEYGVLALYCLAVLGVSLIGGYVPFLGKVTHAKLQMYLSVSAGVMLGASFFHVMPDGMKKSGDMFGWWMALGVVGLFCIERFIAPHSHEMDGGGHHHNHEKADAKGTHDHDHDHDHDHNPGDHENAQVPSAPKDIRAAAPAVAGWMAVVGLTIHTFMNGVGLAGAVVDGFHKSSLANTAARALPGLAVFLAIVLHKPMDALAISTVLSRKGVSRQRITLVQLGFAIMVPIGVLAFYLSLHTLVSDSLRNQLTGFALAFSAGTFLFIALSDLLPEVQFHRHDRIPLFLLLVAGVVFMGFIALLEPSEEDEHNPEGAPAAQVKGAD
jgi:zinc and cadmium transporter